MNEENKEMEQKHNNDIIKHETNRTQREKQEKNTNTNCATAKQNLT